MTLTLFHATWCGPCKQTKPAFSGLRVPKMSLDIDTDIGRAAMEAEDVKAVPTLILKDHEGNELERLVGAQSKASIEALIARHAG